MPTTLAPELEGLSNFDIVMICEGVEEPKSEEQYFACWQHLVNTGQAWSLQGWFGRTALQLIEAGHITR